MAQDEPQPSGPGSQDCCALESSGWFVEPSEIGARSWVPPRKEAQATMPTLSAAPRREDGQGLAEYALILSLIAVIAIAALVFLGTSISTLLSNIGAAI